MDKNTTDNLGRKSKMYIILILFFIISLVLLVTYTCNQLTDAYLYKRIVQGSFSSPDHYAFINVIFSDTNWRRIVPKLIARHEILIKEINLQKRFDMKKENERLSIWNALIQVDGNINDAITKQLISGYFLKHIRTGLIDKGERDNLRIHANELHAQNMASIDWNHILNLLNACPSPENLESDSNPETGIDK